MADKKKFEKPQMKVINMDSKIGVLMDSCTGDGFCPCDGSTN
jgi:hypothetical protein